MQTQVDEGLSAPESKGEVHKKPASFDPADIAALTEAMNEYAEASKYHLAVWGVRKVVCSLC